jgi:hypothetical protein
MVVEISLKHILMRAEMCFDATMEGCRVGYCDLPVVVPLMERRPHSYGPGLYNILHLDFREHPSRYFSE